MKGTKDGFRVCKTLKKVNPIYLEGNFKEA